MTGCRQGWRGDWATCGGPQHASLALSHEGHCRVPKSNQRAPQHVSTPPVSAQTHLARQVSQPAQILRLETQGQMLGGQFYSLTMHWLIMSLRNHLNGDLLGGLVAKTSCSLWFLPWPGTNSSHAAAEALTGCN